MQSKSNDVIKIYFLSYSLSQINLCAYFQAHSLPPFLPPFLPPSLACSPFRHHPELFAPAPRVRVGLPRGAIDRHWHWVLDRRRRGVAVRRLRRGPHHQGRCFRDAHELAELLPGRVRALHVYDFVEIDEVVIKI